jgi:hypothetical protein
MQPETLITKIQTLPPERVAEVEDFVEFLAHRERLAKLRLRDEALAAYVAQWAGTENDLDPALEQAGIDCWLAAEEDAA